jgi:uncharacterized lipoprotein YddW (UPF0748 family)
MKPCYRFGIAVLLFILALLTSSAQVPPKREFRGAWIATVVNLDWPSGGQRNPFAGQQQRDELIAMLDQLVAAGINAVVFQVRTECDALYKSSYEPWSFWLTGTQGTGPFDGYDPLEFAVQEAHKRGMELHAWFNPYRAYRAYRETNTYLTAANHVTLQHPEWILTCPDGYKFLDPGLPAVRDHAAKVIADVVRRYDVDGVHMDDYFYPYPEHNFANQDAATFASYSRGITNVGDWRRDNVNLLIRQIYDSVQAIKPFVKVGMSPFGIWRPNYPSGIFGLDAYNTIYCDALAWIRGKYIDYITPQLYWAFGGGTDYGKLQPWWADSASAYGRHLYTGIITTVGASEIGRQIDFNRGNPKVGGSIIFRANLIAGNSGGVRDLLTFGQYRTPALIPVLSWKDTVKPNSPSNVRSAVSSSPNLYDLQWDKPAIAADGDTALRYIVYRFTKSSYQFSDLEDSRNLLALSGQANVTPPSRIDTTNVQYFFGVAALDRNNNESPLSSTLVTLGTPVTTPLLAYPPDAEQNFPKGEGLKWSKNPTAVRYKLQVARASDFLPMSLVSTFETSDTAVALSALAAQSSYYWRVVAGNQGGVGSYTNPRSFKTGWPLPPTLLSPPIANNISRTPTFLWSKGTATSYRLRVTDIVTGTAVIDVTVGDTTFLSNRILEAGKIYTWVVSASNAYGSSDWSAEGRFRTGQDVTFAERNGAAPNEFALSQNYPNPFNPATKIEFALPQSSLTTLKVYDLLGRELATLVQDDLAPGRYVVEFDGRNLPSGVYIYRLMANGSVQSRKMQLLR